LKKVLILGKSGYVPSHLGSEMRKIGFEVLHSSRNLNNEASDSDLILGEHEKDLPRVFFDFLQSREIDAVVNTSNAFSRSLQLENASSSLAANLIIPSAALIGCSFAKTNMFINLASGWQLDKNRASLSPHYTGLKNAFASLAMSMSGSTEIWQVYVHELFGPGDARKKLLVSIRDAIMSGQRVEINSSQTLIHLTSVARLARHLSQIIDGRATFAQAHSYVNYPSLQIGELILLAEKALGISIPWSDKKNPPEAAELANPVIGKLDSSELAADLKEFFRPWSVSGGSLDGNL